MTGTSLKRASEKPTHRTIEKPFRILALDGGGVRGLMHAVLLERLEEKYPKLFSQIDCFAGTSAGSIISTGLALGKTPKELKEVWMKQSATIFKTSWWHKVESVENLFEAQYDASGIRDLIVSVVGERQIKDIPKKILIPAFNLDPMNADSRDSREINGLMTSSPHLCNSESDLPKSAPSDTPRRWAPVYFHNFDNSDNADTPVGDACLRSAAAPTYFPIYQGYVDGGVFANNPSMAALSSALCGGLNVSDVSILSLSTGNNPKSIPKSEYGDGNWGLYKWGFNLIDLLMDSTTCAISHQCSCILGDRYLRVDPLLSHDIDLADASPKALQEIVDVANKVDLEPIIKWIEKYWNLSDEETDWVVI